MEKRREGGETNLYFYQCSFELAYVSRHNDYVCSFLRELDCDVLSHAFRGAGEEDCLWLMLDEAERTRLRNYAGERTLPLTSNLFPLKSLMMVGMRRRVMMIVASVQKDGRVIDAIVKRSCGDVSKDIWNGIFT